MSGKIRVGLIGAGRIGQVHAASIAENHDVDSPTSPMSS